MNDFWENLTPLDSSHLEVFLEFFWIFFHFLNSNLNFKFGPVWYLPKPKPGRPIWPVTGQTRPVPTGLVNPGHNILHRWPLPPDRVKWNQTEHRIRMDNHRSIYADILPPSDMDPWIPLICRVGHGYGRAQATMCMWIDWGGRASCSWRVLSMWRERSPNYTIELS